MKKLILILLQVIAFSIFCKAQTPGWGWAYGGGGSSFQYPNGLAVDDSGYIYIGGRFAGTLTFNNVQTIDPTGGNILYIGKFDTSGNGMWLINHEFSGDEDYPRGFCIDHGKNNHIYDCGIPSSGDLGSYVVKYTSGASLLWDPTIGTGSFYGQNPEAHGVAADTAGDVYITGETGGGAWMIGDSTLDFAGTDLQEMFLAKMDKGGNFLWAVGMDGVDAADDGYDVGRGIAIDYTAQYVYVAGSYTGTPSFHSRNPSGDITGPASENGEPYANLFLAKYDTAGNLIWVTYGIGAGIPDNPADIPWSQDVGNEYAVAIDSCDNVFVTGLFSSPATFGSLPSISPTNGFWSGFVATCNSKGQWQWVKSIVNPSGNAYASCLAIDKDNDIYMQGTLFSGTTNFGDGITATTSQEAVYVAKYANSTGDVQWVLNAGGPGNSSAGGLGVDKQKFVYLTGAFSGSSIQFGSTTVPYTTSNGLYIAKIDTIPARYIVPYVQTAYCLGAPTELTFTIQGTFNPGNVFTAQLSDSTGSFINATDIGDTTSTSGGTMTITIPVGTPAGTTYLIRVVSSNPATSSYVNGCGAYFQNNVYINNFYITIGAGGNLPALITPNPGPSICNGSSVTLTASGGHTYLWSNNGSTDSVITVSPTADSTFTVLVTEGSCQKDTSITITVGTTSLVNITPQSPVTCNGADVTLSVPVVSGTTYTWSPASTLSSSTGTSVVASPSITTTYSVSGSNSGGCSSSGTDIVSVGPAPPFNFTSASSPSTCAGKGIILTVPTSGSGYEWNPSGTVYPDTGNTVTATPLEQTTYTVTGRDSLGCLVTAYDTVYITKGVNKPTITDTDNVLTSSATQSNQWYVNGNKINNATGRIYNATATGCYWTVATNLANGCSSISDTICVTGINRLSINPNLLSIYPNPTGGELFVNISPSVADVKDWNLQITDVLGRTVYNRLSLNYSNEIDLSNLPGGVYFITIINNSARAVYPVVKQN